LFKAYIVNNLEKNSYKLIDLSHTVKHGMITYKGLPGPVISDYLTREASNVHYEQGTSFHIGKIDMVANTGTYVDSLFHRYADGKRLKEIGIEAWVAEQQERAKTGFAYCDIRYAPYSGSDE
jgi:kynurenine formamidase